MDEDTKPAPTPKKRGAAASAAGAGTKRRKQENGGYDIQREDYDDMSKYMHQKTWEDLVQAIDTVEHDSDGLSVYFQMCAVLYAPVPRRELTWFFFSALMVRR
jgi:hypothetical protein